MSLVRYSFDATLLATIVLRITHYCILCVPQTFLAIIMVSIGTINQLIDGFTFVSFIFYTLSIVAVLILRVTHRKEPRIFKVR